MMPEMDKTYDPKLWENRLYSEWERDGRFHDEPDESRKPFTIVNPPAEHQHRSCISATH